jgi:hypothetical protein
MNWKYKIKIKDHFDSETTPELIIKLCKILVKRLKSVIKDCEISLHEDSVNDVEFELEENRDNFEFLLHLVDGTISESEWHDYGFEGDFETEFNGYLSQLYDTADNVVKLKNGTKNKLLWIE